MARSTPVGPVQWLAVTLVGLGLGQSGRRTGIGPVSGSVATGSHPERSGVLPRHRDPDPVHRDRDPEAVTPDTATPTTGTGVGTGDRDRDARRSTAADRPAAGPAPAAGEQPRAGPASVDHTRIGGNRPDPEGFAAERPRSRLTTR